MRSLVRFAVSSIWVETVNAAHTGFDVFPDVAVKCMFS